MSRQVIIIGSGPAAWTAAIYAARAHLEPVVFEGKATEENRLASKLPGGQLSLTTDVENFPGFPDGINGPTLIDRMRQQAIKYGTQVFSDDVTGILYRKGKDETHVVQTTAFPQGYETHTVIIATGASAKYLNVPGEERFKNNGVSACATCDGALPRFRDKPVAVVGGGDSACEEAHHLSKYASKVYLIVRREDLRASKTMQHRVKDNPKIGIIWDTEVKEVIGDDENGVTKLLLGFSDNVQKGQSRMLHKAPPWHTWEVEVSGLFCAIGHTPNTGFLKTKLFTEVGVEAIQVNFVGYINAGPSHFPYTGVVYETNTSIDGIFAAGDCADPTYRQAITAAGKGCMAALDVERYLTLKGV